MKCHCTEVEELRVENDLLREKVRELQYDVLLGPAELNVTRSEYGVMFRDGSVRHAWNGRTAQRNAEREAEHLREVYTPDEFHVVSRRVYVEPWRVLNG